ncbi:MAG: hypothetical protein P4L92_05615 [Rudaea sp.]|nr:hypothetical protein [Rudaea sp.]
MYRSSLALILSASCALAAAQDCSVTGKALGRDGKPLHSAFVRLTNLDTRQSSLGATDANADFRINGGGGGQYRLDLLSPQTRVTGSLIPTRSIVGMTADFSCRGGERQDVRAQVD